VTSPSDTRTRTRSEQARKDKWQGRTDRILAALFVLSLSYLAFLYGFAAGVWKLPPYDFFRTTYLGVKDVWLHWKNDFGFEPTRHLVAAGPDRSRISVLAPDKVAKGYKLISGLSYGRDALFGAWLLDREGTELHYWPVKYDLVTPQGRDPENIFLHGLAPLPDGSIVVNFDGGDALARIDACGRVIWRRPGGFHHAVSRSYDGTLWSLLALPDEPDQLIVQLDQDGRVLRRISLLNDVIVPNHLQGIFAIRASEGADGIAFEADPFHMNDIEVLDPAKADAFPQFEAGDLLISLRSLNMLAVLDGDDYRLKWSRIGPWYRQHDPDFLEDGTISAFNNDMGSGSSEIIAVNPQTGALRTLFKGTEEAPFYSWQRGKHQHLENGNILITEAEGGRVLEVDAGGHVVWQYQNVFDDTRNGVIGNAIQLPLDFFERGALVCP
jgi:Arylsulfotransferase (ASST)